MKLIILVFTFAFSGFASAEGQELMAGSEFLYQAPAGVFAVTPHINGVETNVDFKASSTPPYIDSAKSTAFTLGGSLGYGLSDMAAVHLDVGFSSIYNSSSCSSGSCYESSGNSGVTDPVLGIKLRNDLSGGQIRYGADLNASLEKAKTNTAGLRTNASSGGIGLTPWVGYEHPIFNNYLGAVVSYQILGDRKQTASTGTDSTLKDGQALTVAPYFEWRQPMHTAGFALVYRQIADTHVAGVSQQDGHSTLGLKLYNAWYITQAWTLIPHASYNSSLGISSGSRIQSEYDLSLGFAARYTF